MPFKIFIYIHDKREIVELKTNLTFWKNSFQVCREICIPLIKRHSY